MSDYREVNAIHGYDADEEPTEFQKDLEALINKHSKENLSDTPDFILAITLEHFLSAISMTIKARDDWYNFDPWAKRP